MEKGLYNITSATTTTLIDFYKGKGSISSIRLTNAHASTDVTVDFRRRIWHEVLYIKNRYTR